MGSRARNEREKELLKQKIKQAATELIVQKGYEHLSMRKLAAKIEYSPTTIYLYYENKSEIIKEMEEDIFNHIMEEVQQIIAGSPSLPTDLLVRECLLAFIRCFVEKAEMAKAIIYSGSNRIFGTDEEQEKGPENVGISMMDMIFARGIEEGIFKPEIGGKSWMVAGALLGFVMTIIEHELYKQAEIEAVMGSFADILLKGICNEK